MSVAPIDIRAVRPDENRDRAQIWTIFREVVSTGTTYAYPSDTTREEAVRLWIEEPSACYVAETEDRIVGTYYLKTNQPGRGAHVCNAGYMVHSEFRGRGIGRALCRHSLETARERGYVAMQYNLVVSTNEAAVRLWKEMGFEIVGTLPKAFDHAEEGLVDAHVMYRLL